jgi:hypothetical protein
MGAETQRVARLEAAVIEQSVRDPMGLSRPVAIPVRRPKMACLTVP